MPALLIALLAIFILPLLVIVFLLRSNHTEKRVCIVVLGDIGRSPRMQYHAISFASQDWHVDFVGYGGSTPHADLVNCPNITCYHMKEPPASIQRESYVDFLFSSYFNHNTIELPRLAVYAVKVLWQSATLFSQLMTRKKPSHLLLQNPPALPTLAVLWAVSIIRGSCLVVDWHNYGYTILALATGERHPITQISKWYEHLFGRLAHANICVTDAMREDLRENWGIKATTMHDRPPSMFKSIDVDTQHRLLVKLSKDYNIFLTETSGKSDLSKEMTRFTEKSGEGHVTRRRSRPALLVSSTSWTEDEDFSVLLAALESYEQTKLKDDKLQLPDLVCAITGKGPQKEHYIRLLKEKSWTHVSVITPWLEAEDYPLLLGSADVGVCLHTSSSGLDLPMKVVDMFGCGLPVCAVDFRCLSELVRHNHNGLVFQSSSELADQLKELLAGFPKRCEQLDTFRDNLKAFQSLRWQQAWECNVLPLFSREKLD